MICCIQIQLVQIDISTQASKECPKQKTEAQLLKIS